MSKPEPATIEQPTLTPEQEQEKWLGEALRNVKDKSTVMRGAMAQKNFVAALRGASQMLTELRTGMLTPQNYYELYMKIFDELQGFEAFLHDEVGRGRSPEEMYEVVQHAGNIVPRLYLLITMGNVFIKAHRAPAKDILKDLVEMCKGVQHPTRGLFVRNYLCTATKNRLPDNGNEYDGEGGTVEDSVNFIIQNFKEMVWLWVRLDKLEHMTKARRERERKELRILVGFNLVRLSQLDGITRTAYQQVVLPSISEIVLMYQDPMAQQYLFEVIVQVFPDEFHLLTLTDLLGSLSRVVPGVDVHHILTSLMDRLGNYVEGLREGTMEGGSKKEEKVIRNMFTVFQEQIQRIVTEGMLSAPAYAETQFSLLKLVLKTYPGVVERVDEVLAATRARFAASRPPDAAQKPIRRMLEHLVQEIKDINVVLDLPNFDACVELLGFKPRRDLALALANVAIRTGAKVGTLERVAKLFDIVSPLVKDTDDRPKDRNEIYTIEPDEEFAEEQNTVARLLQVIDCPEDLPLMLKLYSGVRKQLGQGGMERMRLTLKPMALLYMRLAVRAKKAEAAANESGAGGSTLAPAKALQYIYTGDGKGILEVLGSEAPLECFYLYLTCANAADVCELPDLTYELYTEAFTIYEEHAADSKMQQSMLLTMVSSLCALRTMAEENYDIIATKVCQYSSKLLKKPDQCRMAAQCSHLFWKKALSEGSHKKVLECMQRALKISDNCGAAHQLGLYVELLNHFVYYFNAQAPGATAKYILTLVDLIGAAMKSADSGEVDAASLEASKLFFKNTRKYILEKQKNDERWQEIII